MIIAQTSEKEDESRKMEVSHSLLDFDCPLPMPSSPSSLSPDSLALLADYFKVLSEVTRLQILNCLRGGPMNVMELTEATGFSQANLSKHLKIMTQAGILERQPKGVSAYYKIIDPRVFELCEIVCDGISDRLKRQIQNFGN